MHGLRSIEYKGGTLLLVQCLKKKIEARGAKNSTGTRKSCEEKRKEEEKTRENNLAGCSLQKIILFTSRGKCAREATMAAVVTGGEVGAEV